MHQIVEIYYKIPLRKLDPDGTVLTYLAATVAGVLYLSHREAGIMLVEADVPTKNVTISEIFDAIEKNGIPHITGDVFRYSTTWNDTERTSKISGGCAIGMALLNLGVEARLFDLIYEQIGAKLIDQAREKFEEGNTTGYYKDLSSISNRIIMLNDTLKMPLRDIAAQLRIEFAPFLDAVITDVPIKEYEVDPEYIRTPETTEAQ